MPADAVHCFNSGGRTLEGPTADLPPRGSEDARLVDALRRGDEGAFLILVQRHQSAMLRVA